MPTASIRFPPHEPDVTHELRQGTALILAQETLMMETKMRDSGMISIISKLVVAMMISGTSTMAFKSR